MKAKEEGGGCKIYIQLRWAEKHNLYQFWYRKSHRQGEIIY